MRSAFWGLIPVHAFSLQIRGLTTLLLLAGSGYSSRAALAERDGGNSPENVDLTGAPITAHAPRLVGGGDFNGDGDLDITDIDLLSVAIASGSNAARFDLTGDGIVNLDDLALMVTGSGFTGTWLGDADLDGEFVQADLVSVLISGKYDTGLNAGWAEGDWNADLVFNSGDILAALIGGGFALGPRGSGAPGQVGSSPSMAAILPGGVLGDGQTSLIYSSVTGEVLVDAPFGASLTSISITSASGLFVGPSPDALIGTFDVFSAEQLFKATFGQSFASISFGAILSPGMSESVLLGDLTANGSLFGGGDLGPVDLVLLENPNLPVLNIATFSIGEIDGVLLSWLTTIQKVQLQSTKSLQGEWEDVVAEATPENDGKTYVALMNLSTFEFFRLVTDLP